MSGRPWEVPYNGWSYRARCAVTPIQERAFRSGALARPTQCSICGFIGIGKRDGRWQIVAHLERYDRPLELFPVCRPCHGALHGRFTNPDRWQRLIDRHGHKGGWFTMLSLDPRSQWQPFEQTYSNGLASPSVPSWCVKYDLSS